MKAIHLANLNDLMNKSLDKEDQRQNNTISLIAARQQLAVLQGK